MQPHDIVYGTDLMKYAAWELMLSASCFVECGGEADRHGPDDSNHSQQALAASRWREFLYDLAYLSIKWVKFDRGERAQIDDPVFCKPGTPIFCPHHTS